MPKITLVTNIAEFGLFRSVAKTRARLIGVTLLVLGAAYGAGLWTASYIFEQSTSVVLNLLLITLMMMLVLVVSYLMTVIVGDFGFSGRWREQVILGQNVSQEEASVEDHSAEFMIIFLLMMVANAWAINWAAGGFLDRYHNEGFFQVRLRADDPDERLDALEDLADPMNYELWEIPALQKIVLEVFDDDDSEVRQRAFWTAGHMEVEEAEAPLITVTQSEASSPEKAEAAIALAKLGDKDKVRGPLEALATGEEPTEARVGALRGLGLLKPRESVEPLLALTSSRDEDIMVHAFWALREIGSKEARPVIREHLEAEPSGIRRCAVFDALKRLATEEDIMWARRTYQRTPAEDDDCEHLIWTDHNGAQHYIVYGDSYREKLIKIVANTDGFEHRQWFQRLVNDPDESWRIREVADEVLQQLDEGESGR